MQATLRSNMQAQLKSQEKIKQKEIKLLEMAEHRMKKQQEIVNLRDRNQRLRVQTKQQIEQRKFEVIYNNHQLKEQMNEEYCQMLEAGVTKDKIEIINYHNTQNHYKRRENARTREFQALKN